MQTYNTSLVIFLVSIASICFCFTCQNESYRDTPIIENEELHQDSIYCFDFYNQGKSNGVYDIFASGKSIVKGDTITVLYLGKQLTPLRQFYSPIAILELDSISLVLVSDLPNNLSECTTLFDFLTRCQRLKLFCDIWLKDIQTKWSTSKVIWKETSEY